jgi:twitching motility protein PilT
VDLEQLLIEAERHTASDILVSPGSPPSFRSAGLIHAALGSRLTAQDVELLVRSVVQEDGWRRLEETRELDFAATHLGHRLRGNAFWRDGAPAVCLRLIPHTVPAPDQLGLPALFLEMMEKPQGLILFTGAAGQGKTTSQASLVDHVNRHHAKHIVTIEDPIEFLHPSQRSIVDQREVGRDTNSFADGLRHVMRQNPDIILIGEMRDPETIEAALCVAETGHLVLSTLHANDACQAVDRIVYASPPARQEQVRMQLGLVLLAIVNQRLVRAKTGRLVLAVEVLLSNPAISRLIRDGKTSQLYGAMELDSQSGVQTMNHALESLVSRGVVSLEEATRYTSRRESRQVKT